MKAKKWECSDISIRWCLQQIFFSTFLKMWSSLSRNLRSLKKKEIRNRIQQTFARIRCKFQYKNVSDCRKGNIRCQFIKILIKRAILKRFLYEDYYFALSLHQKKIAFIFIILYCIFAIAFSLYLLHKHPRKENLAKNMH